MSGRAMQTKVTEFDGPAVGDPWTPEDGHSPGPKYREFDPVDVSLATVIRPQWLRGYEDPVIAKTGQDACRLHAPDPAAEAPSPNCSCSNRDGDHRIVERAVYAGFRDDCQLCFGGDQ